MRTKKVWVRLGVLVLVLLVGAGLCGCSLNCSASEIMEQYNQAVKDAQKLTQEAQKAQQALSDEAAQAARTGKARTYIFGEGGTPYATEKEAAKNMVSVSVKVWKLDAKSGKKTSGTLKLSVNKKLADNVKLIFQEIYDEQTHFPIKYIGGYDFRTIANSTVLSEHSYGTCIDINPNDNAYIVNGVIPSGEVWEPGDNPFSMPAGGVVVQTFKKYVWTWGGDWLEPKDYMHFSYLGG